MAEREPNDRLFQEVRGALRGDPRPPTREEHLARFHEYAGLFRQEEDLRRNEDGSQTRIVTYEFRGFEPKREYYRRAILGLRRSAAALGLKEAFSPLVLPTPLRNSDGTTAQTSGGDDLPAYDVQLGYENPPREELT